MHPEELLSVIEQGETLAVEFKRGKRNSLNDDVIVEWVACMANGNGGLLMLGVEDDGRITGLDPRHGATTVPHLLQAMILNRTVPPVATAVEIVDIEGADVAVIEVPSSEVPVGTSGGKFLRRRLDGEGRPECVPYPLHEMISAGLSAQGRDYADTPARGATWDDLDPAEFDRFRKSAATTRGDAALVAAEDEDILRALRLIVPTTKELTLGAVLLFGRSQALERFVPTAEVVFHELKDGGVVSSETMRFPLLRAAARLSDLISVRNTEQEVMIGLHRVGVRRVPQGVIRETLANALVHRDYSVLGPIVVQLDEDRFRVQSPGGFPRGIDLSNLLEDSRPRSPILAEAFKRAGVVDRAGRGVRDIYDEMLRAGRAEPDYDASSANTVVVAIETRDSDVEMVRFILEYEESSGERLPLLQLRILHELNSSGPQSAPELATVLGETDVHVRGRLARMVELGLVDVRGTGRRKSYHLSAMFYRLGRSTEYVRLQDTDPIQQERMVLAYVEQYGRITRGKTAELCRLADPQARALLRRMVADSKLVLRGERRGAHYVLPDANEGVSDTP